MNRKLRYRRGISALLAICLLGAAPAAQARDFIAALFGAFSDNPALAPALPAPSMALPFASDGNHAAEPARPHISYSGAGGGGSQAYCVRTCDGRYFPITAGDGQSRAASCNSFCPASETKVVYGSSIDHAATENGKSYSELPNAFRYRNEIVAGCTCNGKDQLGLAAIRIEDDATLRKGDIVAGANGLVVAARASDRRGASLNFSPASASVRARYQRLPVVASE
ncbi:DUF2865 domain-containing protein [uncultured Bradyrhizobium sp.]|uniref:DUF2865 domain-containing protein n=1 Tax=uncultured Bradyrhizobium sp. TaxID=199684 RepID=UPI0035C9ACFB